MNPVNYMSHLCYQRILPCLEKNAAISSERQSSACFVMCGSEPVMANVSMERVKGLYAELFFPPETIESELFAARKILADEFQCTHTRRGIHWKDDAVGVTLRLDRAPEPLNKIELFSLPDDPSSLKLWNFQNAIRIHNPSGRFEKLQGELGYYSEDTWNDKLLSCYDMLHYRASYDFRNSVRRRQTGAAHQYLGVSICEVLKFCFLINREYPPVPELARSNLLPKFPRDEVARLPILGKEISLLLGKLEKMHTLEDLFKVIWDAWILYLDFLSENEIDMEHYLSEERSDNPFKEDDARWTR